MFLWTSTYLLAFFNFKWCDPEESTSSWSSIEGVACDDNVNCTKGDICSDGQCTGTRFTCDLPCQECNGNGCSLKTGYGFVSNRCTCKITGRRNYIPLQVFLNQTFVTWFEDIAKHIFAPPPSEVMGIKVFVKWFCKVSFCPKLNCSIYLHKIGSFENTVEICYLKRQHKSRIMTFIAMTYILNGQCTFNELNFPYRSRLWTPNPKSLKPVSVVWPVRPNSSC